MFRITLITIFLAGCADIEPDNRTQTQKMVDEVQPYCSKPVSVAIATDFMAGRKITVTCPDKAEST